jgi:hypothetical protein
MDKVFAISSGIDFYNPFRKERGIIQAASFNSDKPDYILVDYPVSGDKNIGHNATTVIKWMNTKKYQKLLKELK